MSKGNGRRSCHKTRFDVPLIAITTDIIPEHDRWTVSFQSMYMQSIPLLPRPLSPHPSGWDDRLSTTAPSMSKATLLLISRR